MRHQITLATTLVCLLLFSGCSRSVGQVNDNNNQPQNLTIRILMKESVRDIAGYNLNPGIPCVPFYPDDDGKIEEDQELCWAFDILEQLGLVDALIGPGDVDREVNSAEAWKTIRTISGLVPFVRDGAAPDIDVSQWFASSFGSLYERELITLDQDGMAHPSYSMPLEEWEDMKGEVIEYLDQDLDKGGWYENFAAHFNSHPFNPEWYCLGWFGDVPEDTPLCHATYMLMDMGYINPEDANIGVNEIVPWQEAIKPATDESRISTWYSGCSGLPESQESVEYVDALCNVNMTPEDFNYDGTPTLKQINKFHLDMRIYYNEHIE